MTDLTYSGLSGIVLFAIPSIAWILAFVLAKPGAQISGGKKAAGL